MTEGIDEAAVGDWLIANLPSLSAPFSYTRIGEGRSNLTFAVTDGEGARVVLRRPPLGQVLATAHDMTREHRVISALAPTDVPVPATFGLCADDAVNGAPFYVMELVDGVVVDSPEQAEPLDRAVRAQMAASLIDVLATLHDVDIDTVGLGDLGRRDGYIERQIRRWSKQWADSKTRDLAQVDLIASELVARIPDQQGVTLVHGDYRFGNCLVDPATGDVAAVLDWELCTLGDPLADLGYLAVQWSDDAGEPVSAVNDPTAAGGFGSFADLLERYAQRSARDLSGIDYYVAFQHWRLAIILEGVYSRYLHGAMGDHATSDQVQRYGDGVIDLVDGAEAALSRA